MSDMLGRGATAVRNALLEHIKTKVEALILVARAQWGLDEWTLPFPAAYDYYNPTEVTNDQYPLVAAGVNNVRNFIEEDISDTGARQYRPIYSVVVFLYARTPIAVDGTFETPEYQSSLRVRDDLAAIVREVLLAPAFGNTGFFMHESTLREEYSDGIKVRGDRWAAGVGWTFDLQVDESLYRLPIGAANTINVNVAAL